MAVPPVSVAVTELRDALNRCLDTCEAHLGSEVDLGADYYWCIETTDAFDLAEAPTVSTGQLTDDLDEIRRHQATTRIEVWHDIGHLLGPLARLAALMQR